MKINYSFFFELQQDYTYNVMIVFFVDCLNYKGNSSQQESSFYFIKKTPSLCAYDKLSFQNVFTMNDQLISYIY